MSNERILVMDDEEIIQEVLSNMLDFLGYEVEIANDGVQAIEKYKQALQSGKSFNAVIMDLTVPQGLGGKEAIKDLIELDSEVTAIVSSGYSNDPVVMNYTEYGFKGAISKPFKIEELKKVLQELV